MSDSFKRTEYGLMKKSLSMARLSELCVPKIGVQTGPFGSQLHKEDYVDFGTPIITVEHLDENRISHINTPFVSEEDKERLKKYQLIKGDIVFSRVGSVDRRAIVREEENNWLFSGRCLRVRADPEKINSEYLSYFFGLHGFKQYIRSIAVGATMPSINTKILSDVPIYFHKDLKYQRKVAKILSTIDDKIQLNTETNQTLEQIAQAIFKNWFIDFDPVHAKADALAEGNSEAQANRCAMQIISGKSDRELDELATTNPEAYTQLQQTAEAFPSGFGEDGLPEGWNKCELSNFGDIICGKTPAKRHTEFFGDEVPFIKIPDMHNNTFLIKTTDGLTELGAGSQPRKYIEKGSICVSCIATVGLVALASQTSQTNQQINSINPKENFLSYYLYLSLSRPEMTKYLKDLASGGSATLNLNTTSFSKIKITKPADEMLKIFDKKIFGIFEKILANSLENEVLIKTRDALLPKLLNGEINV